MTARAGACAPPVLAVGDGALGFWKALREVSPATREQRCWVHKTANVLDAIPKSAQPAAKKALQGICNAEDCEHAEQAIKTFARLYEDLRQALWLEVPQAVARITDDKDVLLEFYDYPAEHWIHLRTTNPIESTFATVRLRTKVTKGAGSRAAALSMVFKLVESAQARLRSVNGARLVPCSAPEPASNAADSSSGPSSLPPEGSCSRPARVPGAGSAAGQRCQRVPAVGVKGPSRAAHCRSRMVFPSVMRPSRTMARASVKGSSSTSMSSPSSSSPPPFPVRSAGV